MISEVQEQLDGDTPAVIVVSVGGGGLMNGVLEGMQRVGWGNVPLVAMETVGADSLNACVRAGDWVELPDITRSATTCTHNSCVLPSFLNFLQCCQMPWG